MASPATNEASEVRRRGRQRLIGAIALVAMLVVFVPMLLDSEPRPQRADPTIPSKADAPPLPTPPPAKTEAKAPAPAPEAAKAPAKPAEVAKVDPKAAEPPKTPPKAAEPAKAQPPATAAQPKLEGFAVQVGAFRDEAKLDQARQKLTEVKVPHYTERLEVKSGPLTRLRAGPFATREAAESALAALKLAALDGKVVPLP